jgi:hypothetical protein
MRKRKKTALANKLDGRDKWPSDQVPNQWGEKLEGFFEEHEVGMDAVAHWKDVPSVEEIDLFNLDECFDMDNFRLGVWKMIETPGRTKTFWYGECDPFQYTGASVYRGRGTYRYDEPGESVPVDTEMKFVFSDLMNLGVKGRVQF